MTQTLINLTHLDGDPQQRTDLSMHCILGVRNKHFYGGPKRVLQRGVTCLGFVIMSGRAITAEVCNAESLVAD